MARSNGLSSLERYIDSQALQADLLERIDVLSQEPTELHSNSADIQSLQREYNDMVKQRVEFEPNTLRDPMQALPPELWTSIIKHAVEGAYPVDHLLILTSVSQAWCHFLISSPSLWTHVILDPRKEDYLSKAILCLHLSVESELYLAIQLPLHSWRKVSSLFIAESQRIRSLNLIFCPAYETLGTFSELPVLRQLHVLPTTLTESVFRSWGLERIPSLQMIIGPCMHCEGWSWRRLITSQDVIARISKGMVEVWGAMPNLHRLSITESRKPEVLPASLNSSLQSVEEFHFTGESMGPILRCIGSRLTDLKISLQRIESLHGFFDSLQRFPCLHRLDLGGEWPLHSVPTILFLTSRPVLPIKQLVIRGPLTRHFVEGDRKLSSRMSANLYQFYRDLIVSMPFVEHFEMKEGVIGTWVCSYIESLQGLRVLSIGDSHIEDFMPSFVHLESLERLVWHANSSATFLARLSTPILLALRVCGKPYPLTTDGEQYIDIPHFQIPPIVSSSLTSLTIVVTTPVSWRLGPLLELRELEIRTAGFVDGFNYQNSLLWASDILEAILIWPKICPALEKIILGGHFFEWDILLLALLRRNILAARYGVSPITAIVVDHDLPHELLYPLSMLLQGKFPDVSLTTPFSIEAIGKRLGDKARPGCASCCYAFRACDKPSISNTNIPTDNIDFENAMLAAEYIFPSESVVADPPLNPDAARWLLGKGERRKAFVSDCARYRKEFHREQDCAREKHGTTKVTITNYCLEGLGFDSAG